MQNAKLPLAQKSNHRDVLKMATDSKRLVFIALPLAAALMALLIPSVMHLDRGYLLAGSGYTMRTLAEGLLTGRFHRTFETPKPLWDCFWLLSRRPGDLYALLAVLTGVLVLVLLLLSDQVYRSVIPGALSSLLILFALREYLEMFLSGSWILPYLILILLALYWYLRNRMTWFWVALLVSGLIRPESWMLAGGFIVLSVIRRRFRFVSLLPLLAPLLWAVYDWRISGNPLYSFQVTQDYSYFTKVVPTSFIGFWPTIDKDLVATAGIPLLIVGVAGLVVRLARKRVENILTDPVLIFIFLPLLLTWLLTLKAHLFVMARFFPASLVLVVFSAFSLPYARLKKKRRLEFGVLLALPLVLGAFRAPSVVNRLSTSFTSQVRASRTVKQEADYLAQCDLSPYQKLFIPSRRYAEFYQLLGESCYARLVSYRELNRLATTAQGLAALLPSLAIWVNDDELKYPPIFQQLEGGQSYAISMKKEKIGFQFELLHQTAEPGGYIYRADTLRN
jgi:hypothetical protein